MIAVEIESFQSIESLKFTIDGFTAVVGGSDLGKSAIVRALKCALTGAAGTDFVRHGPACERRLKNTKKCRCKTSVRISTPTLSFKWEKGDSINKYTVYHPDDRVEVLDRVGQGPPDFLLPPFNPIKIGDNQVLIQVADQFRVAGAGGPIFLLDVTGNAVAEVISDVARLDALNEAMKLVQRDRKDATSTRTVRERDLQQLRAELEDYVGLDAALAKVRGIETKQAEVAKARAHCEKVAGIVTTFDTIADVIRALHKLLQHKLPDEEALQAKQTRFFEVDKLLTEVLQRTPAVKRLTSIDKIKIPDEPTEKVAAAFDKLQQHDTKLQQFESLRRREAEVRRDIDQGEKATQLTLSDFAVVSDALTRFDAVRTLSDRNSSLSTEVSSLEEEVAQADREEAQLLAELKELGLCPTCSGPIGSETHLHFDEAS